MVDTTMDGLAWVRKQVEQAHTDLLREMVRLFCERVMSEEVDAICGAPYAERSDERVNRRNGYRTRAWDTRTGTIDLAVPKLREGSYFPDWLLEPRRRAERAFVQVVCESYVRGGLDAQDRGPGASPRGSSGSPRAGSLRWPRSSTQWSRRSVAGRWTVGPTPTCGLMHSCA